ncbi:BLUF domain-containing protein [Pontixanthobacter sp.]|uniref:BLUF domain-containing protein n=1 Tax=Pontixanthobacter sp. TaxID=2792078 RepID=UPI003C7AA0BA
MHSLIYVSSVRAEFGPAELETLTAQAARKNARREITGMLAFNGKSFMQLLEGEQNQIEALVEKISKDPRHRDLIVIRRRDIEVRECPDWTMRSFVVPLDRAGDAKRFSMALPDGFDLDTRLLFTSFGSLVRQQPKV